MYFPAARYCGAGSFFILDFCDRDVVYQITDHLGSVRAVRDGAGTVRQRFDYYPFGSVSRFWNDTPVAVPDTGVVVIDPIVPGNGLNGGLVPEIGDILPVSIEETSQLLPAGRTQKRALTASRCQG